MVNIKEIKTRKTKRRSRITVRKLITDVKKKLNKEKVAAVMSVLEDKYRTLEDAKKVVFRIEAQISAIENKDIEEIDTDDYDARVEQRRHSEEAEKRYLKDYNSREKDSSDGGLY